jgi:hypothetical protein
MMSKIKTSHEAYIKSSLNVFKRLGFTAIIVVFVASFMRGSEFEIINIIMSLVFIIFSCGFLSFGGMYFAIKASIKLGELEDNGIVFRKSENELE